MRLPSLYQEVEGGGRPSVSQLSITWLVSGTVWVLFSRLSCTNLGTEISAQHFSWSGRKSKFTLDFQLHSSPSTAVPPFLLSCQRLEVKSFFVRSGRVDNNGLVQPFSSCSFPLETVSLVDIRPWLPTEKSQTFRLVALNGVYTEEYFYFPDFALFLSDKSYAKDQGI